MSYHTPEGFRPIYANPKLDHQIVIRVDFYSCNCLLRGQSYYMIGRVGSVAEMEVGFNNPRNHRKPFDPAKHGLGVRPEGQEINDNDTRTGT